MQVLLINQNATIERLVKLSSGKQGYGLALANSISEVANGSYDFVIIDSDLYSEVEFGVLRQKFNAAKTILIVSKGAARPNGFDIYIEKPFLPTELLDAFYLLEQNIAANPAPKQTISAEEAIFEDNIASFADFDNHTDDELKTFDEHDIFGDSLGDIKDEFATLDEYDLGDEISFDDSDNTIEFEKTADAKENMDEEDELEFSFDDEEENEDTNSETLFSFDEEEPIDDFQLDIKDDEDAGLHDFDFSLDDDSLSTDKIGTAIASEELDSFDDLETQEHTETLDKEEEEFDMSEFNNDENVDMTFDEIKTEETQGFEDDFDESEDPFADSVSPHMFEQDEVNKLKNLLDETEDGEIDNDDFDLENVKIYNDELGSLTEESLAEALGVNVKDEHNTGSNTADQRHIENAMDNAPLQPLPDAPKAAISEQQISPEPTNNAIQLTPNQSVTLSLEALKELLSIADITINITLTKKQ